jgi:[acyl-carrier-protein] S-malonyltransferase
MSRAMLVLPGRGAYTPASLGTLQVEHRLIDVAEAARARYDLPSLRELDAAPRFDPPVHLRPANASALIYLISMIDGETARRDHEVVVAMGNSLGWYAALAAAGALSFEDGFRLVQEMSLLQEEPMAEGPGGQVIYPLTDASWRPDPELESAVAHALQGGNGEVHASLDLGAYTVLAGTEAGIARLLANLPTVTVGERRYPLRLAMHGPYHSPLAAPVASAARGRLADLAWTAPRMAIVDGRGARWSPWSTDPLALRDYTLGEQVTTPYRFATSLRVALREWAPEIMVLPGPGNSLGSICAQIVVAEGYRGIRSRADFDFAQGSAPLVLSMRR